MNASQFVILLQGGFIPLAVNADDVDRIDAFLQATMSDKETVIAHLQTGATVCHFRPSQMLGFYRYESKGPTQKELLERMVTVAEREAGSGDEWKESQ